MVTVKLTCLLLISQVKEVQLLQSAIQSSEHVPHHLLHTHKAHIHHSSEVKILMVPHSANPGTIDFFNSQLIGIYEH